MTVVFLVLGGALLAAGFVGCVLPVIPGPPLAFGALLLLGIASSWATPAVPALVAMGVGAVLVTALDYLLPPAVARRVGGTRAGMVGAVVGMILGTLLLPPFGAIGGAFVGAVVGEIIGLRLRSDRSRDFVDPDDRDTPDEGGRPLRAGMGVFAGTLLGVALKLAYTSVAAVIFVAGAVGAIGTGA